MALNDTDLRAYEAERHVLERDHYGKFVVFHDGQLIGIYDDFDTAGNAALRKFGNQSSLIRKIGESSEAHVANLIVRSQ